MKRVGLIILVFLPLNCFLATSNSAKNEGISKPDNVCLYPSREEILDSNIERESSGQTLCPECLFLTFGFNTLRNNFINHSIMDKNIGERKTLIFTLPFDSPLDNLVVSYSASEEVEYVKIGEKVQYSGLTHNNFLNSFNEPVIYTLISKDKKRLAEYQVIVSCAPGDTAKEITNFSIGYEDRIYPAHINGSSITVILPYAANFTSSLRFSPSIVYQGASVTPGNGVFQEFSLDEPVLYRVKAVDRSSRTYSVKVKRASLANSTDFAYFYFKYQEQEIETLNYKIYPAGDRYPGLIEISLPAVSGISFLKRLVSCYELKERAYVVDGPQDEFEYDYSNSYLRPVEMTVRAEDGTTRVYQIRVYSSLVETLPVPSNKYNLMEMGFQEFTGVTFQVEISPFYIGRYEVTFGEWTKVRQWQAADFQKKRELYTPLGLEHFGYQEYDLPTGWAGDNGARGDDHPVTHVNWYDAVKWCNALSEMERLTPCYYLDAGFSKVYRRGQVNDLYVLWQTNGYRLLTEAEWEYAARFLGLAKKYQISNGPSGKFIEYPHEVGNIFSFTGTLHVGGKKDEDWGDNYLNAYDMTGNVFEWVWDWADPYTSEPKKDPKGFSFKKEFKVKRGGSWRSYFLTHLDEAGELVFDPSPYMNSYRTKVNSTSLDDETGFRVCRRFVK
jgi:formylglycine-generating enzyme required for sulfatase activity